MKRLCVVALVALGFCFSQVETASAQQANQGKPGIVAVLDLPKIFNEHPGHKAKMEALQKKFESLKQNFMTQQERLKQDAKNASANFQGDRLKQMELQLETQNTKIRTEARQAQTDMMKEEAKIYYETYQDIMKVVNGLCQKHNVTLVLRYDSTPIDPSKPQTVIRGVQRSVVFSSADLTPLVLQSVRGPATSSAMKN